MKHLKTLAIAAVAGMALTAFFGAGSASATVLCKTELTSGCTAAGWDYASNTVFAMSLEEASSFEATGGTLLDTCSGGIIKGRTANSGNTTETVSIRVDELIWELCSKATISLHNANPGAEGTFGLLEIHWFSGTDNGTVTGKNSKWTVNTGFASCTYGTGASGTHIGTLTATPGGNKMATLHLEAIIPLISGGLCPGDYRWTGSYTVWLPESLHVSTS